MSSSSVQSILGLLAQPVGGTPLQYMIEKAFLHHDLDWRYLTFEVGPAELGDAVRGLKALDFRGGHCGDPHKQAVIPFLDRTTETASAAGAVNVFFRDDGALVGDNTEGKGVLRAVGRLIDPAGKKIVLLGAGRIARATVLELIAAGAGGIAAVDRSETRLGDMAALAATKPQIPFSTELWQGDYAVPTDADVLIQATSIELNDEDAVVPIKLESLRPELLVADVTPVPPQTPLLHEAAARGCKTVDGLSMFIEQVAFAFHLWTGIDPDRTVLRDAVEEYWEV